ncbi:MAG TPA: hypothetical protein VM011_01860 [Gammaproteobacteria bacterium]|nr:hypothetical protein [Gammaproteobacteria bacterium]
MDLPAAKGRHVHRLNSEAVAAEPTVKANADDESVTRAERHDHHGHDKHHGHRGHGFGFGRYGMGMGHAIHEQMRAARREVASEQVGEAVADLTTKVAEVIGAAGQLDGLDAAQENFTAAVQDVVDRFESGEIGRRSAMAGFRAAFEDLADVVRSGSADDTPVAENELSIEINAVPADGGDLVAGEATDEESGSGSLVENLGQVFNSFMQGLRSDFTALGGMRSFLSAENRDMIRETFVGLYRELAGLNAGGADVDTEAAGVDQLA